MRWHVCILNFAFCISFLLAGCAPRQLHLPTGGGTPLPDFATIHADISKRCAGVRTLTAELALSGRAGDQKLRGRALAGFEAPDSMRLEGLAPFGPPAFILVARDRDATLLLPRDDRVLEKASAADILGALTGVSLAPADLQAILTGCVVPAASPVSGMQYGADWRSIELDGGATLYLRRVNNDWILRAAERSGWRIEYPEWQGDFPRTVRLISLPPASAVASARPASTMAAARPASAMASARQGVDVTANISQLEANLPIDAKAFAVDVPRGAVPITLDELRQAGPLRGIESR